MTVQKHFATPAVVGPGDSARLFRAVTLRPTVRLTILVAVRWEPTLSAGARCNAMHVAAILQRRRRQEKFNMHSDVQLL